MQSTLSNDVERRKHVRLRLRADLQVTPQKYEGRTHYVVKDPVSLRYYRFNDQEYFVVKHFDGTHTLDGTQKKFEDNFRPHRLTLEDLEGFAQQLLQAGLVQHETPMAGNQLFDKRRKQRRLQQVAQYTNILYIKLPVFDPDKLLKGMLRFSSWIFTQTFLLLSVSLMLSAVLLVTTHFQMFYDRLPAYHEFFKWNTLLYLWVSLGVVKVIHEMGHGLSCKAFGGECHEMGALFLCLSPCLYANVSDSWTIPNKWKRIAISFAGIYVELIIAALATWVWWYTQAGTPVNHLALCVMVLCSVSTVVFNANPLMRFDGYYMLADWLEIPNLRDRANRVLQNMAGEHLLGMEVQPEPYMEPWRLGLFLFYAVFSYIYRYIVTFSVLFFLARWLKPYNLGTLSMMLAFASLASMVGWPVYRLFQNLGKRGRLPDMKRNRVTATTAVALALVAAFFFLPVPISQVRQSGLVSLDRESLGQARVTVPDAALLQVLHVHNGQHVFQGQLLAEFRSMKLEAEKLEHERERDVALAEAKTAGDAVRELTDPGDRRSLEGERAKAEASARASSMQAEGVQRQIEALRELRAPCDGVVMSAPAPDEVGKLWDKDSPEAFCLVGDPKRLRVLVPIPPADYRLMHEDMKPANMLPVTIRVPGRGTQTFVGKVTHLPESDAKDVPLQLTQRGGGNLAVKPNTRPNEFVPQEQTYLVEVELLDPDPTVVPGVLAHVKVHCQWRSCAWWVWRKISSLLDLGLM